jgi:hypothetical protein
LLHHQAQRGMMSHIMRHPFHPMRLATVTFKTWQAQNMRQARQPCNIPGQHHRTAHAGEGKVALLGWLGFRVRLPEGEYMTILVQQWLQHGHAAKDFERDHQVTQLQRPVARACWDLTLHQSPTVAIDEDCAHGRTHKVPHHVTAVHAGPGQHVTLRLAAAAAVRLEGPPLAVPVGGAYWHILWSAVNKQPHTTVVSGFQLFPHAATACRVFPATCCTTSSQANEVACGFGFGAATSLSCTTSTSCTTSYAHTVPLQRSIANDTGTDLCTYCTTSTKYAHELGCQGSTSVPTDRQGPGSLTT